MKQISARSAVVKFWNGVNCFFHLIDEIFDSNIDALSASLLSWWLISPNIAFTCPPQFSIEMLSTLYISVRCTELNISTTSQPSLPDPSSGPSSVSQTHAVGTFETFDSIVKTNAYIAIQPNIYLAQSNPAKLTAEMHLKTNFYQLNNKSVFTNNLQQRIILCIGKN